MKRIALLIALVVGAVGFGAAQEKDSDKGPIVLRAATMYGVLTHDGVAGQVDNVRRGLSLTADFKGEQVSDTNTGISGHFNASLDYVGAEPSIKEGNVIVSGNWALALYENEQYVGTLYGGVRIGNAYWKSDGKNILAGRLIVELEVKGGTKGLENAIGDGAFAHFDVGLDTDPSDFSHMKLGGRLEFAF